jgi:acyl CoA:acetate/3-ketoacid CoA transferase beta subunit
MLEHPNQVKVGWTNVNSSLVAPPETTRRDAGVVDMIVTELAVIDVTPEGLVLREIAPDSSVHSVLVATQPELIVSPQLKVMSV